MDFFAVAFGRVPQHERDIPISVMAGVLSSLSGVSAEVTQRFWSPVLAAVLANTDHTVLTSLSKTSKPRKPS